MESTVLRIATDGTRRDELVRERQAEDKPQVGRPKSFAFRWQAPAKAFAVQIRFRKTKVSKAEVIAAVRSLLNELQAADQ